MRRDRDPFRVGAVMLAIVAVAVFLGFTKDIPFVNEPYQVKAAFRDSSGLKPGSPVRIGGVEVGKVAKVEHVGEGNSAAVVTMAIQDRGRPVHSDARAKIRPRIFLEGNFFVELSPGTGSAPELGDGDTIPADRTANPVQLDEVLKALQSDVRADLSTTLVELGRTQRAGGGRAFNDSLRHQPAAYRFSAIVAEALLGERPGDLGDYVRDQGIVSAALDRDRAAVRDLVTSFDRTAAALADRESELRETLVELPQTLRAGLPALATLNEAFPPLRALARAALPAVRSTGPTVDALLPLVRQLRGLVGEDELRGLATDLRAATPSLARLAAESPALLEQLRLLSSCATEVLVPWAADRVPDPNFPATGEVHQELGHSLVGLAGESRSFDANGQWFKVLGTGGTETVSLGNGLLGTTAGHLIGTNPPAQRDIPPLRPDVPCETQQRPDLRTQQGAPPRRVDARPNSAAARARYRRARGVAIDLMRRSLDARGSRVRLLERDATLGDIKGLARKLGLTRQLERLAARQEASR